MTDEKLTVGAPAYRVLARKYRPQTFADLIGQEAMVKTLSNAIASNRIAQAYMLTGVRGIGKTTTARLIARALNYPGAPAIDMPEMTPQDEAILESRHMDVIEMDAASNTGVDNMREIIDSVRYAPVSLRYKIYIIDEVHMLSKSAFNALLKTLEEPPPHVKFIFATTEIRKVPVTILSRCQRFDLKRLSISNLMAHYGRIAAAEQVSIDEESLRLIARAAEGSVRDGLSLLDQAIAHGEGQVKGEDVAEMLGVMDRSRIIDLFDAVMRGDAASALSEVSAQFAQGGDPETILADLADFVHWVTRLKITRDTALNDPARTEMEKTRGSTYAAQIGMAHLTRAWQMLLKGLNEVNHAPQPIQAAEMLLIRLIHALDLPSGADLVKLLKETPAPSAPASGTTSLRALPEKRSTTGPASVTAQVMMTSVQPAPQSAETEPPPQARSFSKLGDILALVNDKRDVKLKGEIERYIRPIRIAQGQVEIALEHNAPAGLPGELSRKLEAWTGQRWIVSVAKAGGEKPVHQQRQEAQDSALQQALSDPDVQAILARFPKAEITQIREAETIRSGEESDEESR